MLSILLSRFEKEGKESEADFVKRLSPVAWRHINFYGNYEFNTFYKMLNLEAIIQELNIDFKLG